MNACQCCRHWIWNDLKYALVCATFLKYVKPLTHLRFVDQQLPNSLKTKRKLKCGLPCTLRLLVNPFREFEKNHVATCTPEPTASPLFVFTYRFGRTARLTSSSFPDYCPSNWHCCENLTTFFLVKCPPIKRRFIFNPLAAIWFQPKVGERTLNTCTSSVSQVLH